MSSHWLQWTCCGMWPFGKSSTKYQKIINMYEDDEERVRAEIDQGLPPGVSVGDLLQNKQNTECLKQAYILAIKSNEIEDYLKRFDAVKVPDSCQNIIGAQISKLKSIQQIIWNTMISMAVGNVSIDDSALKTLLNKQAGESIALLEMEKLAAAIQMDTSTDWAADIASVVTEAPGAIKPNLVQPIYDEPEGMEMAVISSKHKLSEYHPKQECALTSQ
nr:homolog of EHV2 ORF55 tegument protein UL51 [Macronycteris gammaherpesvirus 1]